MTALIIIGCIILFFVFLFTVHAYITIELRDEMALTIRILGIPIHILPAKPKKYKYSHYTLKKIRKREKKEAKKAAKKAAKQAKSAAEKAKKKAEKKAADAKLTKKERKERKKAKKAARPSLVDLISLVLKVAKLFFSRFFGKLHIQVARIHIRVASADVAQTAVMYGAIYQAVGFLMMGLKKITHMDDLDKADIVVVPDYLTTEFKVDLNLTFRVSIGNVLGAAIKAGWKFLMGYLRIKPDPDHPKPSILPPKPPVPPMPDAPVKPEPRS